MPSRYSPDEIEDALETMRDLGSGIIPVRVTYIRSLRSRNGNCSTVVRAFAVTMDREIMDVSYEVGVLLDLRQTADGFIVPCSVMDHPDRWINRNSENLRAYEEC